MENLSELEKIAVRVLARWYEETQFKKAQESKLQLEQEQLIKEHRERCAEEESRNRIRGITVSKGTGQVYYNSTDRDGKAFSGDSHYIQNVTCNSNSSPMIDTPQSSTEGNAQFHWNPEAKLETETSIHDKISVSNFEVRAGTARKHAEATNCFKSNKAAQIKTSKNKENMVSIGSGRTLIPKHVYDNLDWNSYTSVTRKLLQAIFSRETLSTHSLSGRPSPAFAHKPVKKQLNRIIIQDIIATVSKNCRIQEKFVRTCITVKCADEAKMLRLRQNHSGA